MATSLNRQVIIFIKEEIKKALDENNIDRQEARRLTSYASRFKLNVKQEWALKQYLKDRMKLSGESVRLLYDTKGRQAPESQRYYGNIIGFERLARNMPRVKVHWADDQVTSNWLYQIDFLKEDPHLTDRERGKIATEKLLGGLMASLNEGFALIKRDLTTAKRAVADYTKRLKQAKSNVVGLTKQINSYKQKSIGKEIINKQFKAIKKLDKVDDVYVSEKGNIIVLTKELLAVENEKEKKSVKLGRFTILLDYQGKDRNKGIHTINRDWKYGSGDGHGYGHPHISGTGTCWGNMRTEVHKMYKEGRILQLIDFMIIFYSSYPHEGGSPHVGYSTWLRERRKTTNNTLIERKINARRK